jgi:hypothetical protein
VIPEHPAQMRVVDLDLDHLRRSLVRNALAAAPRGAAIGDVDLEFLAAETRWTRRRVEEVIDDLQRAAR